MATRKDDKEPASRPLDEIEHQQAAMESAMHAGARGAAEAVREFTDISHGDVDLLLQSGARLAKGMQDMGWEVMQYTQESLRMSLQAANQMMTCRTAEDWMQLQRNYLKDSVDTFLQESARLLQMSTHVTSDAVSPIADRIQTQAETVVRH